MRQDAGGHPNNKLWSSIELKLICTQDMALVKDFLKQLKFAGKTNVLQERWLQERWLSTYAPFYVAKDLGV